MNNKNPEDNPTGQPVTFQGFKVKEWRYWSAMKPLCQDDWPADWLANKFLDKRGVYLWLVPDPEGMRLMHVGCSYGMHSSLRYRTLCHYNNYFAFCYYDEATHDGSNHGDNARRKIRRLDKLPAYDKGSRGLTTIPANNHAKDEEIRHFLAQVHVLYLAPEPCPPAGTKLPDDVASSIRALEGAIVRSATVELTNTRSKTAVCNMDIVDAIKTLDIGHGIIWRPEATRLGA
jgi:hypothetical protein